MSTPLVSVVFGCDPEFFFTKEGKVIGSEKVIPEGGLEYEKKSEAVPNGNGTVVGDSEGTIVVDGVQAELNPRPNTCRANLANELSLCFRELYTKSKESGIGVDFSQAVQISAEEMQTLSEKSRKFGCAPSKNEYTEDKNSVEISVDAESYPYRAAGGHIHLGTPPHNEAAKAVLDQPERLVPVLDAVLGNTCVMLDRDPGNVERRKLYGKAGEYRLPPHGLEYRTLSNFWLKSYPLMSFVMSMARYAVSLVAADKDKILLQRLEMGRVRRAIDNNDAALAYRNFMQMIAVFTLEDDVSRFPINAHNMHLFGFFASKGIDYWFKQDPLKHWATLTEGHSGGWEDFIYGRVEPEFIKRLN